MITSRHSDANIFSHSTGSFFLAASFSFKWFKIHGILIVQMHQTLQNETRSFPSRAMQFACNENRYESIT